MTARTTMTKRHLVGQLSGHMKPRSVWLRLKISSFPDTASRIAAKCSRGFDLQSVSAKQRSELG